MRTKKRIIFLIFLRKRTRKSENAEAQWYCMGGVG